MEDAVLYIHGQSGSPEEKDHYGPLFPGLPILGMDYHAQNPWEAVEEFPRLYRELCGSYRSVILIANSIGAFFALHALKDLPLSRAFFISPVADMEQLIGNMMIWAGVTEAELQEMGEIQTEFGQTLSWDYLSYVRTHPVSWPVPTSILYGSQDHLTAPETIRSFAEQIEADLTILEGGEHWFHTEEQMRFLDSWITQQL